MDMLGDEIVFLHKGTSKYPLTFVFAPCTTNISNDGSIPFGTTISTATVVVTDSKGDDITTDIVNTLTVVGGLKIAILLDYPVDSISGKCVFMIYLTLSSTAILPKKWDGLRLE